MKYDKLGTVIAFSTSKKKKDLNYLIATSETKNMAYEANIYFLDTTKILINLKLFKIKIFYIFIIEDNNIKYNRDEYTNEYYKYIENKLIVINQSYESFMNINNLTNLFLNRNKKPLNKIFIFKDKVYREIVLKMRENNIIVSGGSVTKRQFISPLEYRFVIYLIIIYGVKQFDIMASFDYYNKQFNTRVGIDLTTKEIKESLEEYKEEEKKKKENENKNLKSNNEDNNNKSNKKDINNIKNNSNNKLSNQKREYSTSTLKRSNNKNNNLNVVKIQKENKLELPKTDEKENLNIISFINFINDIIKKSENDPVRSQKEIENGWINYVKLKLENDKSKIRNNMAYIINKAYETFNIFKDNKDLRRKFPNLYKNLKKEHLILTFSIIFTYYNRLGFTSIAMIISKNIIFNLYNEIILKNIRKDNDYISLDEFEKSIGLNDKIDKLKLGSFFIEIFCSFPTNIFERTYKKIDNFDLDLFDSDLAILVLNKNYLDILKKDILIHPTSLPMLCKPNDWSEYNYGGFLNNTIERNNLITGLDQHNHIVKFKDKLYKAINYINSIKFKINNELLNFLENDGNILWINYLKNLFSTNDKLQAEITFNLAKSYNKINIPIYINTFADWRGRIYTQSFYISYQGNDLSASLLNFYEGIRLTKSGKYFLYVYGANCYNYNNISKLDYDSRVNWVKENYDKIINLDINFIKNAESVFLFSAFCLTLKKLHSSPYAKIYLPVFLDATCSGIQHLAAVLQDFETGSKVNLIPQSNEDSVGDLYSNLLIPINEAINKHGQDFIDYTKFKDIKLERKHIKIPIMTKVYNVTVIGIADQLKSIFKKTKINDNIFYLVPTLDKDVLLNYQEIFIIAKIINDQIFYNLPSLKSIYLYFNDIIKLICKLNIPVVWFTPSGLKISQYYLKSKIQKISIRFGGKSKTIVLRETLDKLDKNKQINAIIPNIIHSLDAAHLINLINTIINIDFKPFICVHDCFGTHPNNLEYLSFLVKKEFILLYTQENFLLKFHNRLLQTLEDHHYIIHTDEKGNKYLKINNNKSLLIPIVPELGKLDIKKIIDSKYMIT